MRRLLFICTLAMAAAVANAATGLNLSYIKTPVGSLYQYNMTLSVDESTGAWSPGMGWRWLIFGDVPTGPSPIADFTMTSSFPVGPWTSLSSSSGGHNGPTFAPVLNYWIPNSASETLNWVGTSAYNAPDNTLMFSTLAGTLGGAMAADFKIMTVVPEPASLLVLAGLLPVIARRRRKNTR